MRRALVVGLLVAVSATSCTEPLSSDPWERVEAIGIEETAYLLTPAHFEFDDHGVLTRSSLERWDQALSRLERVRSGWAKAARPLHETPQVIRAYDLALFTVIKYSRFIVDGSKQCHADADDPLSCIQMVRETYNEGLREALVALADAHFGLAVALLNGYEDDSP
jgi:hypothetical protein